VEEGVTYWYFPRQASLYTVSWPLSRWLDSHVGNYDLVHIHALFSFAATAGAFWAARRGVPYLVRPLGVLNTWGIRNRHPFLKRLSLSLVERRVLAHAAAAHFASENEKREAALVAPGTRSVVIPNPVAAIEVDRQPPRGVVQSRYPELSGKRVVLFLSRIDSKKGLDLLLHGFAELRATRADVVLIVAGNGDEKFVARLHKQAEELGVQRDVVWAGFVQGEEKRALFAVSDVFILSSYSENFGIAVVEAMASGLPVIVSDQVGIHPDISRAGAGLVISCDAHEIQRALSQIVDSELLRESMSRNARRLAREFSPEAVTARLLRVYEGIIRGDLSFVEHAL
jgi:glycosyltransferase involved in cell wall biosynthesis